MPKHLERRRRVPWRSAEMGASLTVPMKCADMLHFGCELVHSCAYGLSRSTCPVFAAAPSSPPATLWANTSVSSMRAQF